jgi:hypothetical protein
MSTFPKIDPAVFQKAAALYEEFSEKNVFRIGETEIYIVPSARMAAADCTEEFIIGLYGRIEEFNFADWNEYVTAKRMIYVVRPSKICPNFYICTCPVGIKKHPCKHNVLLMQYVLKTLKNPYDSTPLEPKRKRGRPKLARDALSRE